MSNYIYGPVFGIHNDFVKVPEALHYLPKYSSMSCDAKWLYCTLADMHFRTKVSENKLAEVVRSRLMKLNSGHIEYIFYSLKNTRSEIKNIKNYLVTTLYNAVSTLSTHINLQVNHDLYGNSC